MNRKRAGAQIVREAYELQKPRPAPTPKAVLQELFDLLEEYAPTWYTEDLHDRAKAALASEDQ